MWMQSPIYTNDFITDANINWPQENTHNSVCVCFFMSGGGRWIDGYHGDRCSPLTCLGPGKLEFKLFARWCLSSLSLHQKYPAHICNLVMMIVGRKLLSYPKHKITACHLNTRKRLWENRHEERKHTRTHSFFAPQ